VQGEGGEIERLLFYELGLYARFLWGRALLIVPEPASSVIQRWLALEVRAPLDPVLEPWLTFREFLAYPGKLIWPNETIGSTNTSGDVGGILQMDGSDDVGNEQVPSLETVQPHGQHYSWHVMERTISDTWRPSWCCYSLHRNDDEHLDCRWFCVL